MESGSFSPNLKELIDNNSSPLCELSSSIREKLEDKREIIYKVIKARDQIYAHKDPNPKVAYIKPSEISELVNTANEIHKNIYFNIFFTSTTFEFLDSWNIDYVLFHLSEMKRKDLEELKKKKSAT